MEMKKSKGNIVAQALINLTLILLCLTCVIPIVSVISIAFSKEADIFEFGYQLIPKSISLDAFKMVFKNPKSIINGYKVSFLVTFVGSVAGLLLSALIAYPLSRQDFAYRKYLSFYVTFTMLFNGGMIPTYILMTQYLGLKDSILALIFPNLINVWHIFLLRSFFATVPQSLIEAAKIDGAGEFRIFRTIAMPVCKTGLVTVLLFYVLIYWNDWYSSLLYITSENKYALQYLLVRLMNNLEFISKHMTNMPIGINIKQMPKESTRMAMCLVAAGPMLVAFPFFQKHFVKGITVGAVKG